MQLDEDTKTITARAPVRGHAFVEHIEPGCGVSYSETTDEHGARVELVHEWSASGLDGTRLMIWLDNFCVEIAVELPDPSAACAGRTRRSRCPSAMCAPAAWSATQFSPQGALDLA